MLNLLLLVTALSVTPTEVWLIDIDGAIGPATADHVVRNLRDAHEHNAEAVILRMDTPGGLDQAMRDIIQAILASDIAVIGYVAPQGSRAASAGTYLLYASHVAAMAPATSLGAATPVQMGGPTAPEPDHTPPSDPTDEPADSPAQGDSPSASPSAPRPASTSERKAINDARAYIRGLAQLRGRNGDWAERAVTEAATLNATEALELNVVDLVAGSEQELLAALHGRTVITARGEHTLNTAAASIHTVVPDWRTRFLAIITNPSITYLLILIGIYGLIMELSNPGSGIGGIVGGICLLLALYAMQVLPISYTALALIVLGLALMVAEALSPSFGLLGIGGTVAFLIGSVMLMDTDLPAFQIALPLILAVTAVTAGLTIVVLRMVLRNRHRAVVSGTHTLIGAQGVVLRGHNGLLQVRVHGEIWNAHAHTPLRPGDTVAVTAVDGLTLQVAQVENEEAT